MSDTTFGKFEICLKYFCVFNIDTFTFCEKNELENEKNKILVSVIKKFTENVEKSANLLLNDLELMTENESIYSDLIKLLLEIYEEFLNPCSLKEISKNLSTVDNYFDLLLSLIFATFVYRQNSSVSLGNSLDHFIKIGEMLRNRPNFKNTPMGILNLYFNNPKEIFQLDDTSKNYLDELVFEKCFYALAAPSFEGKTQFAFVINSVRPLYFALYQYYDENAQSVYLNFESLNLAIQKFAEKDIDLIKLNLKLSEITHKHITAGILESDYYKTPFWILGFLAALITDAESDFDKISPGINWMKFHANRKNLEIVPMSIEKFEKLIKSKCSKYCLFLDEFVAKNWAVLIRNLARVIGLRCVVANTNTEIANITGKTQSVNSRTDPKTVWSIVINGLNPPDLNALDSILSSNVIIMQIKERFGRTRDNLKIIDEFLGLLQNELHYIRPGIAVYLIKSLDRFLKESQSSDFGTLINYIFDTISSEIKSRKTRIVSEKLGILANIGLLTPIAYVKDDVVDPEKLFHRVEFLRDHLYYLINPSDKNNWIFLTIYPEAGKTCLSIYKKCKKIAWDHEICFFNEKDVFTSLACIFIPFEKPIASILKDASDIQTRSPYNISNADNITALSLNGNSLEVMAAASIVDSTHHGLNETSSSLSGQGGVKFMNNLIQNLITTDDLKKNLGIAPLICSVPILKQLEKLFVPFLFPFNCEIPPIIDFVASQTDGIKVGQFIRTANVTKIDGKFNIFVLNSQGVFVPSLATVECKKWKEPVPTGELAQILIKTSAHNSPICFIFCSRTVKDPQDDSILYNYCEVNNILLYRIKKAKNDQYEFVEFFDNLSISTPIMTVFIMELDEINIKNAKKT